ncbi:putative quorum-sensing-regulated virulence factor [Rhodanobacter sp. UC4451_H18]
MALAESAQQPATAAVSLSRATTRGAGRLLADLPAWFAREGFPPGQWGRSLALALEIDRNGLAGPLDPLRRPPR